MRRPREPLDVMPFALQQELSSQNLVRLLHARYYEPTTDITCCYPHQLPPHLKEKEGLWILPPKTSAFPSAFYLEENIQRAIAQMVLQEYYVGPILTVPIDHGLEVFEAPSIIKPLEIGSPFVQRLLPGLHSHTFPSTSASVTAPESSGVILGRFEYFRALKGIHADSDDFSGFSDSDGDGDEKQKEERRLEGIRRRNVDRFFRMHVYKNKVAPTEDEQQTARAFLSVKLDSAAQYVSNLRGILKAGFQLTINDYNRFISMPSLPIAASTMQQYFVAFKHYIKASGQSGNWEDRANLLTQAAVREKGGTDSVRGSLTEDLAYDLVNTPEVKAQPTMRDVYILLSATGVRCNQLVHVKFSDCKPNQYDNEVWNITVIRNHKGSKKVNLSKEFEIHHTNPFWKKELDRIVAATKRMVTPSNPDPYLCPAWQRGSGSKERQLLKKQAVKLGWRSELSWVLHSFRNGAACDAFMKYASEGDIVALAAVQAKTGHISLEMLRHYAVTNEDRVRYKKMKLDDCLLRATGVVSGSLDGHACPPAGHRRLRSMVSISNMKSTGDKESWKVHLAEEGKKQKSKKKQKGTVGDDKIPWWEKI